MTAWQADLLTVLLALLLLSITFWLVCHGPYQLEQRRMGRRQYPAPNRAQRRARARS